MNEDIRRLIKNGIWCPSYLFQYYKILNRKDPPLGKVIITLDIETACDFIHWMSKKAAIKKANANREIINQILSLAETYQYPLTWFCTGHSLLDKCSGHQPRIYSWATANNGFSGDYYLDDWYTYDPHGSYRSHPEWYFGDVFRSAAKNPLFEIGSHSFGHIRADLASKDEFKYDMLELLSVFKSNNINLSSHAFPWNKIGHLSLLNAFGIKTLREKQGIFPSTIKKPDNDNMCITYQSFEGRPASFWCLKLGIDIAARASLPFIWLVHPEELISVKDFSIYKRICEYTLSLQEKNLIRINTISNILT